MKVESFIYTAAILWTLNLVNGRVSTLDIAIETSTQANEPYLAVPVIPPTNEAIFVLAEPQPISLDMLPQSFQFRPETKDELFGRIDNDEDGLINFEDYLKRDRFYVQSVRNEFDEIDTNDDTKISKREFDDYVEKLENQHKSSLLKTSNFTLKRHDYDHDSMLSEIELATYINGTLQRSIANLSEVFNEYDTNKDGKLNLDEFSNLDLNFPWGKFPLKDIKDLESTTPVHSHHSIGNLPQHL